ncbi:MULTISPECIES: glutathione S-transferase family protein [unclassified Brevundimonas]|jgi:glutathione S-transferase|uniref:FtsZ-binding protein FzlA n=1 Tax=unclassified Brevundimonas TaxID=2622653 RepID=UPI000C64352C|nr:MULTISPECIES: glutathione S-transferase family protein [unclassified Brevundimonas]MAL88203.1 glutathione S-transferase [Brevundimonas sp.]HAJ04228.1 glutathione S-transferase [Brevundimonas sp.]|tara:strand:+ start:1834 stop:2505 length:672 start_codon:yes stop_codon:yes gene_type:complete
MADSVLYHFAFDPGSRCARLALGEAKIAVRETPVKPWEDDCPLHGLNPSGMPPVLKVGDLVLCESAAILGWVDDQTEGKLLFTRDDAERAEMRRLTGWFERKFTDEVQAVLLHERMEKPLLRLGPPEARALRAGREALKGHLAELEGLTQGRDWLAGRRLGQADLVAAAHLSVLDYFGEIAWATYPALKDWYVRMKCRPCFRALLADRLPGQPPVAHYDDLDF